MIIFGGRSVRASSTGGIDSQNAFLNTRESLFLDAFATTFQYIFSMHTQKLCADFLERKNNLNSLHFHETRVRS